MALIRTSPPTKLTLYATQPTPPDILDRITRDFALAAHEGSNPVVQLVIDQREDFLNVSPENVLQVLEKEQRDAKGIVEFLLNEGDGGERWCRALVCSRMAAREVGGESGCGRRSKGETVRGKAVDSRILVRPPACTLPS
jgi:Mg-chelatase subunit ChlI